MGTRPALSGKLSGVGWILRHMAHILMIGTSKGLFVARSDDDRRTWQISGPDFPMTGVYAVAVDKRGDQTAAVRRA